MEVRGVVVGFEDPGDCTIIKVTKGRGWDQEEHLPSDFIESEHIHCELGHWYVGRSLLKMAQQIKPMKIWSVDFNPVYPVGGCLIINARTKEDAHEICKETIKHTNAWRITEVGIAEEGVIVYRDGEY